MPILNRLAAAALACCVLVAVLPGTLRAQQDPPAYAFVGLHGGVFEALERAAVDAGVRVRYLADDDLAAGRTDLTPFDAVLVQHVRTDARRALADLLAAARARAPRLRCFALSGGPPALDGPNAGSANIEQDAELQAYYGDSEANLRRLLDWLRVRVSGRDGVVEPPVVTRAMGIWHPEHQELMDLAEYRVWLAARPGDFARRPVVAVAVHTIHLTFQQPAIARALVERLEQVGLTAFAIVDTSEGLAALRDRYEGWLRELRPEAVVHTCHSTDRLELRALLDVPHTTSVFFRKKSIADWAASRDGIDPSEVVFQIASQELLGAIEPFPAAGTNLGGGSAESFVPVPERLGHLVDRTKAWVELRRKANADKRVALVYWDRGMDKADLMRGSATGMHMNAPQSLLAVTARLLREGYALHDVPADEPALIAALQRAGRQIPQHDAAGLQQLVEHGDPVLLPVATYERWLEQSVPAAARAELNERWGPPPGRIMAATDAAGVPCFVIPRIDLGGLVLLPQPLRGEAHDNAAIHDKLTCPPHHYVATYLWLQHELQADAVVHFGTHGSEFMLPGRSVGLGPDDWPDILLGTLPNVAPWIVENLGEAMVAKRRAYAVLVGHLPPPAVDGGLADELANLHTELERWLALGDGALRERFRERLSRAVVAQRLDVDLHLEPERAEPGERGLFGDDALRAVDDYLHRLAEETTPVSLHTFGQRPSDELLIPHLVSCLRQDFRERLAALGAGDGEPAHVRPQAERLLRALLVDGLDVKAAFATADIALPAAGPSAELAADLELARTLWNGYAETHAELDGLVHALAGGFVAPGPGRGPMRNPGVLPPGRNLYSLNPDEVPARASWELGKQLADELLRSHLEAHGEPLRKVAFSLSSFATFQDYGVMEAQVLWLLGCEPIWDRRNLVRDFRVVPRAELGRPRVDVFLSALSYYRDNLPSRMALLDRAVRAVAVLGDEADNAVAAGTREGRERLLAAGLPPERAELLAAARVFGYAPGMASSANYYYLVERSGDWQTREDLMAVYLDAASHVYTEGHWGEPARAAYEAAMQGTEVVLRTWFDNTTSPLANKYTWYTGGSLALAIEQVTGKKPEYTLVDVRDEARAGLVAAEDALRSELRVRLFNRKWIEGMKGEGYAGADQMKVMVSNVFGWEIMREGSIDEAVWDEIVRVYLDDEKGLGLREFFAANNPHAEQGIAELLLEAARKGYWQADAAMLQHVAERYRESVREHGPGGGLLEAGRGKVAAYAESLLSANEAVAAATGATAPVQVTGQRLEPAERSSDGSATGWVLAFGALGLFLLGLLRRSPI